MDRMISNSHEHHSQGSPSFEPGTLMIQHLMIHWSLNRRKDREKGKDRPNKHMVCEWSWKFGTKKRQKSVKNRKSMWTLKIRSRREGIQGHGWRPQHMLLRLFEMRKKIELHRRTTQTFVKKIMPTLRTSWTKSMACRNRISKAV